MVDIIVPPLVQARKLALRTVRRHDVSQPAGCRSLLALRHLAYPDSLLKSLLVEESGAGIDPQRGNPVNPVSRDTGFSTT
jgi:hypothetical protein